MPGYAASLCLRSADLNVQAVSNALGVSPSVAHQRGDRHIGARGIYAPFTEGLWCWRAPCADSDDLDVQLRHIMRQLDGTSIGKLVESGIAAEILIGVFLGDSEPSDIALPQDVLAFFAMSGAALKVAIYPYFSVAEHTRPE